jgi:hypothetical protein
MTWQWDDVRFFLAVARAGSLSGAARALGVGHVTVGRRITLLERQLGLRSGLRGRRLRTLFVANWAKSPSQFTRRSTTWRARGSRSKARDWRIST